MQTRLNLLVRSLQRACQTCQLARGLRLPLKNAVNRALGLLPGAAREQLGPGVTPAFTAEGKYIAAAKGLLKLLQNAQGISPPVDQVFSARVAHDPFLPRGGHELQGSAGHVPASRGFRVFQEVP